jgi:hypothetical protein
LTHEVNGTQVGTAGVYTDISLEVGQGRIREAASANYLQQVATQLAGFAHGWASLAYLINVSIEPVRAGSQALLRVEILVQLACKIGLTGLA